MANRNLLDMVCYSVIASMGTLLIAIGLASPAGLAAALYYAMQSTLTSAGLFLLAGILLKEKDGRGTLVQIPQPMPLYAGLYFLFAIAMVGMPPLAGFIGKFLILDAGRAASHLASVWPAVLVTSLMLIVGFARTGIRLFWSRPAVAETPAPYVAPLLPTVVVGAMVAAVAMLSAFAGPVMNDMTATAEQIFMPQRYIAAVLHRQLASDLVGE